MVRVEPAIGTYFSENVVIKIPKIGIQIRKSKNDLNMEALSIGCRNEH